MKLLIGVLYSFENELNECLDAILNQNYKNFDYFIIKGLPNKVAHDTLYHRFMENSANYDIFIKIDADMVLCQNDFFYRIVNKFKATPLLENLSVAVLDYFTNSLIFGLNIYKNSTKWNLDSKDLIFVDRIDNCKVKEFDESELAPAAYHCPNPSKFQAFHYGLHKAVKVMQNNDQQNFEACCYHWSLIKKIEVNWLQKSDINLALTLLGAEIAFALNFSFLEVDYNSLQTLKYFEFFKNLSIGQINELILKYRRLSFGWLSPTIRRDTLYIRKSRYILSIKNIQLYKYWIKMVYYHIKQLFF